MFVAAAGPSFAPSRQGEVTMDRTEAETARTLITELTPFLSAPDPLAAAKRAGVTLPPDLGNGGRQSNGGKPFPPAVAASLATDFGAPPPLNVSVGPRPAAALSASGYALIASTDLSVLNDVLNELWRVETIPHRL